MTERDDALKELGRMVTERRESIGMTLETVFDRTKIRPEYLRGIEEGDYKNFPEIVYVKGFVRTYLKLIGAEDLQDDFMADMEVFIPTTENLSSDIITPTEAEPVGVPVSVDAPVSEEPEPEPEPYLEIHAANDVWLSVTIMTAPNAQPIFRRTMRRGESMRWDLTAPIRAVIGRPNAAQVVLNGRDLGIVNPSAKRSETYIYNPDGTYSMQQSRRR